MIPAQETDGAEDGPRSDATAAAPALASLFGSVFGVDGSPAAEASITVLSGLGCARITRTDLEGRFRIERLALGNVLLYIHHARYQPLLREGIRLDGEVELNLTIETGTTIAGRVVDDLGLPLEGASIIAANEIVKSARADADGRFTISGLGFRPVAVTARAPGFSAATIGGLTPGSERVELRLAPGGVLSGVLEVEPLPPIFTVHLTTLDAERGLVCRVRTQTFPGMPRGEFRFEDLTSGEYGIEVEASGFEVLDQPRVVVASARSAEAARIRLRKRGP